MLRIYLKHPTVKRLTFTTRGQPGFELEGGSPQEYSYVRVTDDKETIAMFSPVDFSFAVVDDGRLQTEEVVPVLQSIKDAIESYESPSDKSE